jgi:hypothetical protein
VGSLCAARASVASLSLSLQVEKVSKLAYISEVLCIGCGICVKKVCCCSLNASILTCTVHCKWPTHLLSCVEGHVNMQAMVRCEWLPCLSS